MYQKTGNTAKRSILFRIIAVCSLVAFLGFTGPSAYAGKQSRGKADVKVIKKTIEPNDTSKPVPLADDSPINPSAKSDTSKAKQEEQGKKPGR